MQAIHLFCRVVDNYGDIGVSWRLARQWYAEHACTVTLWVDDLVSFRRLHTDINIASGKQWHCGVCVRHWTNDFPVLTGDEVPDLVVEAFGCRLPDAYLALMAARPSPPVWINLEYLSAEAWVEGCHGLPSPHPSLPLTKYFFFPGFTQNTGGLPFEKRLIKQKAEFFRQPRAEIGFLHSIGVPPAEHVDRMTVSLFCYSSAPVEGLCSMLASRDPALLLVPEGVATEAVSRFLQAPAVAGACRNSGALRLRVIPFLEQQAYDRLLWSCDLNFVRGEDSLVRAQWAEKPFVWQIYAQEKDAHLVKLDAFLARYLAGLPEELQTAMRGLMTGWTLGRLRPADWQAVRSGQEALRLHGQRWANQLRDHGDLASRLLRFADEI